MCLQADLTYTTQWNTYHKLFTFEIISKVTMILDLQMPTSVDHTSSVGMPCLQTSEPGNVIPEVSHDVYAAQTTSH